MNHDTPLSAGQVLTGAAFDEPMRVETVRANGPGSWAVGMVGARSDRFRRVTLTAGDLAGMTVAEFPEQDFAPRPTARRRGRRAAPRDKQAQLRNRDATTLDRVHAAMLLQANGHTNALRTLITAEQNRGPDFLRLANALSALYPRGSEEKRVLDAMLLAVTR